MGSVVWAPLLFVVYAMAQIATVGNNIFLGFWSSQKIKAFHGDQGDYMAIYAAFGIAAGIFTFASTLLLYLRGITASYTLVNQALAGVMRSKVSCESGPTRPQYPSVASDFVFSFHRVRHYAHRSDRQSAVEGRDDVGQPAPDADQSAGDHGLLRLWHDRARHLHVPPARHHLRQSLSPTSWLARSLLALLTAARCPSPP